MLTDVGVGLKISDLGHRTPSPVVDASVDTPETMASSSEESSNSDSADFRVGNMPTPAQIHRLSPEILGLIFFKACVKDSLTPSTYDPLHIDDDRKGPVVPTALSLSGVCSRWRRSILSPIYAGCWASFELSDTALTEQRHDTVGLLALLRLYLNRSGPSTLYIQACFSRPVSSLLFAALVQHAHRWGSLRLDATIAFLSVSRMTANPMPRLAHLDITISDVDLSLPAENHQLQHPPPTVIFSPTPVMRTLTLSNLSSIHWNFLPLQCATGLKKFASHSTDVTDTLRIAYAMPALEELILTNAYTDVPSNSITALPKRRVYPGLLYINVDMCERSPNSTERAMRVFVEVLLSLAAPRLEELHIDLPGWPCGTKGEDQWRRTWERICEWPRGAFRAFISLATVTMTSLVLETVDLDAEELVWCLEALYGLETFRFGEPPVFETERLVKWLTRFEALSQPWSTDDVREKCGRLPRLEVLGLSGKLDVSDDMLVMMVESRMTRSGIVCAFPSEHDEGLRCTGVGEEDEGTGCGEDEETDQDENGSDDGDEGPEEDEGSHCFCEELDLTSVTFFFRNRKMDPVAQRRLEALLSSVDGEYLFIESCCEGNGRNDCM